MLQANFWLDKYKAQKIIKEKKLQEDLIKSYNLSVKECNEISDLFNLAVEENNKLIINESLKNLEQLRLKAKKMKSNVFSQAKVTA